MGNFSVSNIVNSAVNSFTHPTETLKSLIGLMGGRKTQAKEGEPSKEAFQKTIPKGKGEWRDVKKSLIGQRRGKIAPGKKQQLQSAFLGSRGKAALKDKSFNELQSIIRDSKYSSSIRQQAARLSNNMVDTMKKELSSKSFSELRDIELDDNTPEPVKQKAIELMSNCKKEDLFEMDQDSLVNVMTSEHVSEDVQTAASARYESALNGYFAKNDDGSLQLHDVYSGDAFIADFVPHASKDELNAIVSNRRVSSEVKQAAQNRLNELSSSKTETANEEPVVDVKPHFQKASAPEGVGSATKGKIGEQREAVALEDDDEILVSSDQIAASEKRQAKMADLARLVVLAKGLSEADISAQMALLSQKIDAVDEAFEKQPELKSDPAQQKLFQSLHKERSDLRRLASARDDLKAMMGSEVGRSDAISVRNNLRQQSHDIAGNLYTEGASQEKIDNMNRLIAQSSVIEGVYKELGFGGML